MRVFRPSTACTTTSPPLPPLPPSGPPNSMYFSRRKATTPSPPSPAFTQTLASSRNFMGSLAPPGTRTGARGPPSSAHRTGLGGGLFGRLRPRGGHDGDVHPPLRLAVELD